MKDGLRRKQAAPPPERLLIKVKGTVQGVGFRPYVYGLATSIGLRGYVANTGEGVTIDVEGVGVKTFLERLESEAPPLARINSVDVSALAPHGYTAFSIIQSSEGGSFTLLSPDVSVCDDCLRELYDRGDRRYLYPFINCTNCGPRYTITLRTPYDRPNTTMAGFRMCPECEREYKDPGDRRFHAEPVACPACGPKVFMAERETAPISKTIELLGEGKVVAIKGLGGFHLACDATNSRAVETLRQRKRRSNKPFALMAPDLETIKRFCLVSPEEEALLLSERRPIVLLRKKTPCLLPEAVAPGNNRLGFMLPYTPLHYLLFCNGNTPPHGKGTADQHEAADNKSAFKVDEGFLDSEGKGACRSQEAAITGSAVVDYDMKRGYFLSEGKGACGPLVMTSGNLSEEPIQIENKEALRKLQGLADAFLLHDRDIFMRVDDPVLKVTAGRVSFIRRARGYTPEAIMLHEDGPDVLAAGADIKNTFTLMKGPYAIVSQHIGDMENYETLRFFEETLENLKAVYRAAPVAIAHDMHPGYMSTRWAMGQVSQGGVTALPVQHHHAHIASVMAGRGLKGEVIGVAFDGTGYGPDGTLWGGEFLVADALGFHRAGHVGYVPLPGGEMAVREPWRTAVSYIKAAYGDEAEQCLERIGFFEIYGRDRVEKILRILGIREVSPLSSGAGRLFDAVSAVLGICGVSTFEGEAAIALEAHALEGISGEYPFDLNGVEPVEVDFGPALRGIISDLVKGVGKEVIAAMFHNTVIEAIVKVAGSLSLKRGIKDVVLTGGVFQNDYLLAGSMERLEALGLRVFTNEAVPINDAGVSLGQAYILRETLKAGRI
jgi:hydrogenase maturation protein HypF